MDMSKENRRCFPLVFGLLSTKKEDIYKSFLKELRTALGDREIKTEVVITDFEKAAINVVDSELTIPYGGCYFHLRKNLLKKAYKLGLQKKLGTEIDFQRKFKFLSVLSFFPPSAFETLSASFEPDHNVQQLLEYFGKNYVKGSTSRIMRQGRIIVNPPKYPPEFWSVSSRTELGFPRTQNAIESWHNRFNILVGECHPNPYSLVEEFREEGHCCCDSLWKRVINKTLNFDP